MNRVIVAVLRNCPFCGLTNVRPLFRSSDGLRSYKCAQCGGTFYAQPLIILWRRGDWRCDYLRDEDGRLTVRLFRGDECIEQRMVPDAKTGHAVAQVWRPRAES